MTLHSSRCELIFHVPKAFEDLLVKQGKPVPKPISGRALIDTGASISAVDNSIITSLGVQPLGLTQVHSVNVAPCEAEEEEFLLLKKLRGEEE